MEKIFFCFFLCLGSFQLFAQKPQAYEQYLMGVENYEKGRYKIALDLFLEAEELGVQTNALYNYLGICYYHFSDYKMALLNYNKAIRLEPNDYAAISNKCNAYYGLKEYKAAKEIANQLIKKKQFRETAYNTLGNILYDSKQYLQAIENYRKAIYYDGQQACSYYNIGNAFFQLKMYDTALVYHLQSREINPNDLKNLNNISMCYSNTKRMQESLEMSRHIISIDSTYYAPYAEIGYVLMDNPNFNPNEVIPYLLKAIELAPDIVYYSYNNLGNIYVKMGLHDKALIAYNNAIRINPYNVKSYSGRADIYRDSMQFDKAIADFMMAIKIDSNYNYPNMSLGGIMLRLNQHEQSEAYYKRYIELSADKRDAYRIMYNAKAYNQSLVGQYDSCLKYTALSLALEPKYAYAWNNRGFALAKTGKIDSAFICLNYSQKIDPYNSYVYHNRAFAYAINNEPEKACEELRLAKQMHFPVQIDPLLLELNARNCHFDFNSKKDTIITNMQRVYSNLDGLQKVLETTLRPVESNFAESNVVMEKTDLFQNVYPNPALTDFAIQLKVKLDKPAQLQVMSMNASFQKTITLQEGLKYTQSISCVDWPNGTYVLILSVDGKQMGIGKVVVLH